MAESKLKKMQRENLPVYCIETFQDQYTSNLGFDVKILENLVDQFAFTNLAHRHDFYDVLIITQGRGIHTIDFVTYEVKPGSVFFLTPGQVHSWELSNDVKGYSIFFSSEFYLMHCNESKLYDFPFFHSLSNQPCLYLNGQSSSFIPSILSEMIAENQAEQIGREDMLRACLDFLLIKLARQYERIYARSNNQVTHHIRKLEKFIDQHFAEKKKPSQYADLMCISAKYLSKVCKKGVGKTPGELVTERVVLEAKRLLIHSEKTVSQVADQLGYSDQSYFIRVFKKHTGTTPDQYRAQSLGR